MPATHGSTRAAPSEQHASFKHTPQASVHQQRDPAGGMSDRQRSLSRGAAAAAAAAAEDGGAGSPGGFQPSPYLTSRSGRGLLGGASSSTSMRGGLPPTASWPGPDTSQQGHHSHPHGGMTSRSHHQPGSPHGPRSHDSRRGREAWHQSGSGGGGGSSGAHKASRGSRRTPSPFDPMLDSNTFNLMASIPPLPPRPGHPLNAFVRLNLDPLRKFMEEERQRRTYVPWYAATTNPELAEASSPRSQSPEGGGGRSSTPPLTVNRWMPRSNSLGPGGGWSPMAGRGGAAGVPPVRGAAAAASGTGGGYISLIQRSMTAPRGLTPSTPSRGSTPSWRNSTPPATAGGLGFGLGGTTSRSMGGGSAAASPRGGLPTALSVGSHTKGVPWAPGSQMRYAPGTAPPGSPAAIAQQQEQAALIHAAIAAGGMGSSLQSAGGSLIPLPSMASLPAGGVTSEGQLTPSLQSQGVMSLSGAGISSGAAFAAGNKALASNKLIVTGGVHADLMLALRAAWQEHVGGGHSLSGAGHSSSGTAPGAAAAVRGSAGGNPPLPVSTPTAGQSRVLGVSAPPVHASTATTPLGTRGPHAGGGGTAAALQRLRHYSSGGDLAALTASAALSDRGGSGDLSKEASLLAVHSTAASTPVAGGAPGTSPGGGGSSVVPEGHHAPGSNPFRYRPSGFEEFMSAYQAAVQAAGGSAQLDVRAFAERYKREQVALMSGHPIPAPQQERTSPATPRLQVPPMAGSPQHVAPPTHSMDLSPFITSAAANSAARSDTASAGAPVVLDTPFSAGLVVTPRVALVQQKGDPTHGIMHATITLERPASRPGAQPQSGGGSGSGGGAAPPPPGNAADHSAGAGQAAMPGIGLAKPAAARHLPQLQVRPHLGLQQQEVADTPTAYGPYQWNESPRPPPTGVLAGAGASGTGASGVPGSATGSPAPSNTEGLMEGGGSVGGHTASRPAGIRVTSGRRSSRVVSAAIARKRLASAARAAAAAAGLSAEGGDLTGRGSLGPSEGDGVTSLSEGESDGWESSGSGWRHPPRGVPGPWWRMGGAAEVSQLAEGEAGPQLVWDWRCEVLSRLSRAEAVRKLKAEEAAARRVASARRARRELLMNGTVKHRAGSGRRRGRPGSSRPGSSREPGRGRSSRPPSGTGSRPESQLSVAEGSVVGAPPSRPASAGAVDDSQAEQMSQQPTSSSAGPSPKQAGKSPKSPGKSPKSPKKSGSMKARSHGGSAPHSPGHSPRAASLKKSGSQRPPRHPGSGPGAPHSPKSHLQAQGPSAPHSPKAAHSSAPHSPKSPKTSAPRSPRRSNLEKSSSRRGSIDKESEQQKEEGAEEKTPRNKGKELWAKVREFVNRSAARWGGAHPDPKAPGPKGFKGLPLTQQMSNAAALFTRRLQAGSPEFSLTAGARRRMASLERIRNPAARRRLAKHVPTFSRAATAAAGPSGALWRGSSNGALISAGSLGLNQPGSFSEPPSLMPTPRLIPNAAGGGDGSTAPAPFSTSEALGTASAEPGAVGTTPAPEAPAGQPLPGGGTGNTPVPPLLLGGLGSGNYGSQLLGGSGGSGDLAALASERSLTLSWGQLSDRPGSMSLEVIHELGGGMDSSSFATPRSPRAYGPDALLSYAAALTTEPEVFTGTYGSIGRRLDALAAECAALIERNPTAFNEDAAAQAEAEYRACAEKVAVRLAALQSADVSAELMKVSLGRLEKELRTALLNMRAYRPFFQPPIVVREKIMRAAIKPPVAKGPPKWKLANSVFAPRIRENESRGFYDSDKARNGQFQLDWQRVAVKSRFRRLIAREDKAVSECNEGLDQELGEVRSEMAEHKDVIRAAFNYYSMITGPCSSSSAFTISLNQWLAFCSEANIVNNSGQRGTTSGDLQTVFIAVNYEEDKGTQEDEANDDDAMMRFEFLEGLIRSAFGKFIATKLTDDASDACNMLMNQVVLPALPPEARVDPNVFRRERLYNEEMDRVVRSHLDFIHACYKLYKAKDRTKYFWIEHWVALLEACDLIGLHTGIEYREAKMIFAWSQMLVSDELKRRKRAISLTLFDLVESLARTAELLSPPTQAEMEAYFASPEAAGKPAAGVPLVAEYYRLVGPAGEKRKRDSAELCAVPTRPLAEKMEALMQVMVVRMRDAWGGKDVRDCAHRMMRAAQTLSGGIELG